MATTPSSSSGFNLSLWWKQNRKSILPPLLGTLGFLLFWQLSSSLGLTKLTGPLSLWTDERTRELLLYPFYDRGGLDKGLFHHSMSSLGRVAIGYTLAAIVGIGVGIAVGLNKSLDRALSNDRVPTRGVGPQPGRVRVRVDLSGSRRTAEAGQYH